MVTRCEWVKESEPLYVAYHDEEWGVPTWDDTKLFEMLTLEGAQAGLSWWTILQKRENYRKAFLGFDAERIAQFTEADIERLCEDAGIVRNKRKIKSVVTNAQAFLKIQAEYGTFSEYIWRFVDGKPIVNHWKTHADVPASTALSESMSKQLKKDGFTFVGGTIMYSFMQAVGMVNDHTLDCFRHPENA